MASSINLDKKEGYLQVIMGPMYSGKTTGLLRELTIYKELGLDVMYVNHSLDDRSDQDFSTHNPLITTIGKLHSLKTTDLRSIFDEIKKYDVIGIDEYQFFNELSVVLELVEVYNKKVFLSGLNSDFMRNPFPSIYQVLPYVDKVLHLHSACSVCIKNKIYKTAIFSKRIVNSDEQILVGASESYIPVCRSCYLNS
jgi:thymidine kinase